MLYHIEGPSLALTCCKATGLFYSGALEKRLMIYLLLSVSLMSKSTLTYFSTITVVRWHIPSPFLFSISSLFFSFSPLFVPPACLSLPVIRRTVRTWWEGADAEMTVMYRCGNVDLRWAVNTLIISSLFSPLADVCSSSGVCTYVSRRQKKTCRSPLPVRSIAKKGRTLSLCWIIKLLSARVEVGMISASPHLLLISKPSGLNWI